MMISIGSKINWEHPLTSEMFEGTVVRIEDWFEPEKNFYVDYFELQRGFY